MTAKKMFAEPFEGGIHKDGINQGSLPEDLVNVRNTVRRTMLLLRANQEAKIASAHSLAAQHRLMASGLWEESHSVALYVGIRGELDTELTLRMAWTQGRTVWLPRLCPGQAGSMEFVACTGPEQLRTGPFGLREPDADLPGFGPGDEAFAPDLMVLPGVAFDRQGGRLGYGGGYYDRFLVRGVACPRVGLCFNFQLVESLPVAHWDQRVHYICTEECLLCL